MTSSSDGRELDIVRRQQDCVGSLLYRVNPDQVDDPNADPRKNKGMAECVVCGAQTHFYCVGCHHWVCGIWSNKRAKMMGDTEQRIDGQNQEFVVVEEEKPGGEENICIAAKSTCSYLFHKNGIIRAAIELDRIDADDSADAASPLSEPRADLWRLFSIARNET
jgi:hypothetical protein